MLNIQYITTIAVVDTDDGRPLGLAVDTFNRIYVLISRADAQSGKSTKNPGYLRVIDGATNTVMGHIDVGNDPRLAAVDTARHRLYVSNRNDDSVSVIDTSTDTPLPTVQVGPAPFGVAVDPVLQRVYVANGAAETISVIDGAADTTQKSKIIPISDKAYPGMSIPYYIAVNPKSHRVYTANFSRDQGTTISVIDGLAGKVLLSVPICNTDRTPHPAPHGIAVNPSTNRVYVGCLGIPCIVVIDDHPGQPPAIVAIITVSGPCFAVRVDPGINMVWASCGHTVVLIDGETNEIVDLSLALKQPQDIAIDPGSHRAYVTDQGAGVAVFQPADTHE